MKSRVHKTLKKFLKLDSFIYLKYSSVFQDIFYLIFVLIFLFYISWKANDWKVNFEPTLGHMLFEWLRNKSKLFHLHCVVPADS